MIGFRLISLISELSSEPNFGILLLIISFDNSFIAFNCSSIFAGTGIESREKSLSIVVY